MTRLLILFAALLAAASCSFIDGDRTPERTTPTPSQPENSRPVAASADAEAKTSPTLSAEELPARKEDCYTVETGDMVVQKSQTFPVDFAPFKGGCFVTTYNPEFDDPPMESEYAIYVDGKEAFKFPAQFNGTSFGCWVEAVSFQDLNEDGLTDIIVAAKCSGKSSSYSENMVYVNTGKEFTTDETANYKLSGLEKIKDVADFVKKNKEAFFR